MNAKVENWATIGFDDAFEQISTTGKTVKTAGLPAEGSYPVIDQGQAPFAGFLDSPELVISNESPIIIFGDHTRAVKWVDSPFIPGADGVKVLALRQPLDARFFYYHLRSLHLESKGYARHFSQVRDATYGLPPIAEQKRIAQKLDTLLAQVDTLKTRIDAIPALLKRFRQSVLASAMSGHLTGITITGDLALSDCGSVTGGITKNAKRTSLDLTVPYLRVANVQAGHLDLNEVSEIGVSSQEAEKTRLRPGDILIVEGNGSLEHIGRAAMWRGEIDKCSHQNHLIRWRRMGKYLPAFVLLYLASPQGRVALVNAAKSTTGLHTLSISKVSSLRVLRLNLEEQTEIVHRVEQLFAFADQLDAKVATAKQRIDALTQSLLAKAFRGELVPQDPNDEPASVLLERIRAQRAAAPKPKRGRKAPAAG